MNRRNKIKYQLLEYLWWICAIPIYGIAAYPSIYILNVLLSHSLSLFCLANPLAFFFFVTSLLIILGIILIFVPRIREGNYPLERKNNVMKWMVWAGAHNYVRLIGIQRLIYSNPFLRRLYFLAFRANVHPTAIIAYDAVLVDPYLLEIGKNVKIGDLAKISSHYSDNKNFVFKKIIIKQDAIVGGNSALGLGTVMEEGSMLCAESMLAPNTTIPKGEVWFGRPAKRIIKK